MNKRIFKFFFTLIHFYNFFAFEICVMKVIAAEGEQKASRALREASEVIGDSPAALQLRYLQVNTFFRSIIFFFIIFH